MVNFTDPQKARICQEYSACNFAMRQTQRSLLRKYGLKPTDKTIRRIYDNWLTLGKVTRPRGGSTRWVRTQTAIRGVREIVNEATSSAQPMSTRRIGREMGITCLCKGFCLLI